MRKDVLFPTSIEKELRFDNWRREGGIEMLLSDMDDTICPTRQIFLTTESEACDFLAANAPAVSREDWEVEVKTINNKLFEKYGVNPGRWNYLVDEITEKYSLSASVEQEARRIFQQIYLRPMTMLEGASEGLDFIKKVGLPIGIVTHANPEWTWKKYNWLGLKRFVNWDDIFIVDENGHKTAESWRRAISYFGQSPDQCAVVGDSPRSDINPAWEIGVKHCFLVEDRKQWAIHKQPVDPSVKIIHRLDQIAEAALNGQLS